MNKFNPFSLGKITLLLAILVWLALVTVDLIRIFGMINNLESGISEEITWTLELLFFSMLYLLYRHIYRKTRELDFLTLIWRGASTGVFAAGAGFLTDVFFFSLGDSKISSDPFLKNIFYHLNFAFTSAFLISTALLWRHLILYQRSKQVVNQWQVFEVMMGIALFFVFFNQNNFDYSFFFGLILLLILSLLLSSNLKWIPYLNFKEKWKSLLFLFLIFLCTSFLFYRILSYGNEARLQINLTDNLFLMGLFAFVFLYALFSFLVTLFNLPTSSVFEQKLAEAINFQKLSQSIQPEENEEKVLDILLDSCVSASYSDGAWLELKATAGSSPLMSLRGLDPTTQSSLSKEISSMNQVASWEQDSGADQISPLPLRLSHDTFKTALLVPLLINRRMIGRIILVKEVKEGYNKEMLGIIGTFSRQACIAVENHQLLKQSLQNERYQEELKIAQRVQKALLPVRLDHSSAFTLCAYSHTADEVGGDYYDTYKENEHTYVLIIGDVSGKGTSAAFHMAQMKGVFQSLIQLEIQPAAFMAKANAALSKCLEKNHFITASIFRIDCEKKVFTHARAGHIPTLMYQAKEKKSALLEIDGLGLGILRNQTYQNHVYEKTYAFAPGDILVMLTDGILEGKNQYGEQFGYERIKNLVEVHHHKSLEEIQQLLILALHDFVGGEGMIDDDYSLLLVKFS